MQPKPAAICAVCRKPIASAADAQMSKGEMIHKGCAPQR